MKRQQHKAFINETRKAVSKAKFNQLGSLNFASKKKRHPLTTREKENILHIFHVNYTEYQNTNPCAGSSKQFLKSNPRSIKRTGYRYNRAKAVKTTARYCGRSEQMVRNIIKEKVATGNLLGGPYMRDKKSAFDKLTIEQRESIRSIIHSEMSKVKNKVDGATYPTVASIHAAIYRHSNTSLSIPKWSQSTTYKILGHLGFRLLENRDIHYGLLVDNEYTTARRKKTCTDLTTLEKKGFYIVFMDESYMNVGKTPRKHWHDTTILTTKEAKDKNLTTGTIKPPGRGERLILLGAGGREGWENKEIIKRSEGRGNNMEYKKDINMDGDRFEKFAEDTAKSVLKRHKKVAFVIDNASIHNKYREDIPRSGWQVDKLRDFCDLKRLKVIPTGKRGGPTKPDYMRAIDKYVETSVCKYKLDELLKKYEVDDIVILIIRLPPYHPGTLINY